MNMHELQRSNVWMALMAVAGWSVPAWAGNNSLRHEAIIDAPVEEVWKVFTTGDGFKALGVAHAEVDFRISGKIRSHYDPNGQLGDPNTIENTILSYDPLRMIAFRCTKPPASFPYQAAIAEMWSVAYFEPVGVSRTRLTLTGHGYTDSEESQKMREHFDKGNAWTLEKLKARFAGGAVAKDTAALEKLIRSTVGEWALDHTFANGTVLKGRMVAREIVDGRFILAESWLGTDGKLLPHGHAVFGRDPATGDMRAWDFGEAGKTSIADVISLSDKSWAYDWRMQSPAGGSKRFYIEEELNGNDSLRSTFWEIKDGDRPGDRPNGRDPMLSVVWKRTSSSGAAPEAGVKRIEKEVVVAAPLQQVWEAWTTSAGAETFFAPKTHIELRPGGPFEILFQPDAPEGSRGAEGCTVLTHRPMEMIAFTWSAPPQWPEIRKQRSVVVVQFAELDKNTVKVTLQHLGLGEGKDWEEVHQYFDKAWPVVLGRLQERFAKGPLDWEQVRRAREARADR